MDKVRFAQLPTIVKFSTLLTLFLAWVAFAEFFIDRHGLDRHLPFYKVGNLCPYDLAVVVGLILVWIALHRKR